VKRLSPHLVIFLLGASVAKALLLLVALAMIVSVARAQAPDTLTSDTARICRSHYATNVRHALTGWQRGGLASQTYRRDSIPAGHAGYVVDHVIPLELGGAYRLTNMRAQRIAAAARKDRVENAFRRAVCRGQLPILAAQDSMRHWRDW
jgi:hypothetical protein